MQFGIWRALTIFAILLEDKLCFFLNGFGNLYFRSSFCSSNVTHSEKYTFCPAFFEHSMIQVESGILFDQRFCSCNRYRSRNQAPTMSRSRQVTSHRLLFQEPKDLHVLKFPFFHLQLSFLVQLISYFYIFWQMFAQ